jgi:RNA recognition motif-containing protein
MNIYVGNLSRDATEDELRQEFEVFGKVNSVTIVKERHSGQPRGFGFVEMPTEPEGKAAIKGLKERTCIHHWIIDTLAMNGVFYAGCIKCGAKKDFPSRYSSSIFSVKPTNPTPSSPTELPRRRRGRSRKVDG